MFEVPLTVIVPVFNGSNSIHTLVDSIQKYYPRPLEWLRFVVSDDASTDRNIHKFYSLDPFFGRTDVSLNINRKNLGYTKNVNQRIRKLTGAGAIMLLNSDTIVGPNLFEDLHKIGIQNQFLGSISPLSNSATICSLFNWPDGGSSPFSFDPQKISRAVEQLKHLRHLVAAPTTVGFCMYIPLSAIRAVGLFNDDLFPRGYGEENDWCLRATEKGLKHYIYTGAYVHHTGSQSFGKSRRELVRKGLQTLSHFYPHYPRSVERFISSGNLDSIRFSILISLSEIERNTHERGLVLIVNNSDPLKNEALRQRHIVALSSLLSSQENLDTVFLFQSPAGWTLRYTNGKQLLWEVLLRSSAGFLEALKELLPHCQAVQIHQFSSFPKESIDLLLHDPRIKKIFSCDNYYLACPTNHLVNSQQRFCGVPTRLETCQKCLSKTFPHSRFSLSSHRQHSVALLARADHIVFSSEEAQYTMLKGLFQFVAPEFRSLSAAIEKKSLVIDHSHLVPGGKKVKKISIVRRFRKIIFLGASDPHADVEIVRGFLEKNLTRLSVELWGPYSEPLPDIKKVRVRGYSDSAHLKRLAPLARGALVVIPTIWPAGFSIQAYDALLILGTPFVAFPHGQSAQMIAAWGVGIAANRVSAEALARAIEEADRRAPQLCKNVELFCRSFRKESRASEKQHLALFRPKQTAKSQKSPVPFLLNQNSIFSTNPSSLHSFFSEARPFKHFSIDQFFSPHFCEALLRDFPLFDQGDSLNEAGQKGGKSTYSNIRDLGPAYRKFDQVMRSPEFLNLLGRATGISNLIYDPDYVGGGTHENLSGQDLDFHIDFNRHPKTKYHRRLNLILFLNTEWKGEWGGSLELRADPLSRDKDTDSVSILPLFNRCVVFETTEDSWHGFDRIVLPADVSASRKSIAVYFYTETRPSSDTGMTHSTVYLNRPLPSKFQTGYTLQTGDEQLLENLIARRDHHIKYLYKREAHLLTQIENHNKQTPHQLQSLPPLEPQFFLKTLAIKGCYDDLWVGPGLEIHALALAPFTRFSLKGRTPDWNLESRDLTVYLDEEKIEKVSVPPGKFDLDVPLPLVSGQRFVLKVECSKTVIPKSVGISDDLRPLSWLLDSATFES